ncbi:protein Spindly isoform X2 [Nilaparvata lugens]|uniref:protein Spindly isoform X2 n=1 Tax=Nilaparvata lugens TaxID=108931 RepID=UPI00193D5815|nr:protein Spindly isoform X2 [Nilaparvata lugens]
MRTYIVIEMDHLKKIEELEQINHDLVKKLDVKNHMENEMKDEIHLLEDLLKKEKTAAEEKDSEIKVLKAQISKLQNTLEDERIEFESQEETIRQPETINTPVSTGESSILKHLEEEIESQKIELENVTRSLQMYKEQATESQTENLQLKGKNKELQCLLEERNKMLEYKTETLNEIKEDRESLREKAMLLESELKTLQSKPSDLGTRGNSLFAEVEDNRKMLVAKLKDTQLKYATLKKTLCSKNLEVSRLKEQHILVYREWNDIKEEKLKNDSRLLTAHLARIEDLEQELKLAKEQIPSNSVVSQDGNSKWVSELLESKRKEADGLRKELQARSLTEWSLQRTLHQLKSEVLQLKQKLLEQTVGDINKDGSLEREVSPNKVETVLKENVPKKSVTFK